MGTAWTTLIDPVTGKPIHEGTWVTAEQARCMMPQEHVVVWLDLVERCVQHLCKKIPTRAKEGHDDYILVPQLLLEPHEVFQDVNDNWQKYLQPEVRALFLD